MSTPNIPLLDEVIEIIEAHPNLHHQSDWRCETGMCVAGWVGQIRGQWLVSDVIAFTEDRKWSAYVKAEEDTEFTAVHPDFGPGEYISSYAQRRLGLNGNQADALFAYNNDLERIKEIRDQLAEDPDVYLDTDDGDEYGDEYDD